MESKKGKRKDMGSMGKAINEGTQGHHKKKHRKKIGRMSGSAPDPINGIDGVPLKRLTLEEKADLRLKTLQKFKSKRIDWVPLVKPCPVYYPTVEEFKDPLAYISLIQPEASKYGICKIIPPVSASVAASTVLTKERHLRFATRVQALRLNYWDSRDQASFRISNRTYTLPEYEKLANQFAMKQFKTTAHMSERHVEVRFWEELAKEKASMVEYGSDVEGTAFSSSSLDPLGCSNWNLQKLPKLDKSLLRLLPCVIPGVTDPMLYIGMLFSMFCWHVEDHYLYSINYQHMGACKTWYGVPGGAARDFERVVADSVYDRAMLAQEPEGKELKLLLGKTTMFPPGLLLERGVPVFRAVQAPGEFVVTFPRSYHAGFSHGFNCGEAVNFGMADWLPYGAAACRRYALLQHPPLLSHEDLLCREALALHLHQHHHHHRHSSTAPDAVAASAVADAAAAAEAAAADAVAAVASAAAPDAVGGERRSSRSNDSALLLVPAGGSRPSLAAAGDSADGADGAIDVAFDAGSNNSSINMNSSNTTNSALALVPAGGALGWQPPSVAQTAAAGRPSAAAAAAEAEVALLGSAEVDAQLARCLRVAFVRQVHLIHRVRWLLVGRLGARQVSLPDFLCERRCSLCQHACHLAHIVCECEHARDPICINHVTLNNTCTCGPRRAVMVSRQLAQLEDVARSFERQEPGVAWDAQDADVDSSVAEIITLRGESREECEAVWGGGYAGYTRWAPVTPWQSAPPVIHEAHETRDAPKVLSPPLAPLPRPPGAPGRQVGQASLPLRMLEAQAQAQAHVARVSASVPARAVPSHLHAHTQTRQVPQVQRVPDRLPLPVPLPLLLPTFTFHACAAPPPPAAAAAAAAVAPAPPAVAVATARKRRQAVLALPAVNAPARRWRPRAPPAALAPIPAPAPAHGPLPAQRSPSAAAEEVATQAASTAATCLQAQAEEEAVAHGTGDEATNGAGAVGSRNARSACAKGGGGGGMEGRAQAGACLEGGRLLTPAGVQPVDDSLAGSGRAAAADAAATPADEATAGGAEEERGGFKEGAAADGGAHVAAPPPGATSKLGVAAGQAEAWGRGHTELSPGGGSLGSADVTAAVAAADRAEALGRPEKEKEEEDAPAACGGVAWVISPPPPAAAAAAPSAAAAAAAASPGRLEMALEPAPVLVLVAEAQQAEEAEAGPEAEAEETEAAIGPEAEAGVAPEAEAEAGQEAGHKRSSCCPVAPLPCGPASSAKLVQGVVRDALVERDRERGVFREGGDDDDDCGRGGGEAEDECVNARGTAEAPAGTAAAAAEPGEAPLAVVQQQQQQQQEGEEAGAGTSQPKGGSPEGKSAREAAARAEEQWQQMGGGSPSASEVAEGLEREGDKEQQQQQAAVEEAQAAAVSAEAGGAGGAGAAEGGFQSELVEVEAEAGAAVGPEAEGAANAEAGAKTDGSILHVPAQMLPPLSAPLQQQLLPAQKQQQELHEEVRVEVRGRGGGEEGDEGEAALSSIVSEISATYLSASPTGVAEAVCGSVVTTDSEARMQPEGEEGEREEGVKEAAVILALTESRSVNVLVSSSRGLMQAPALSLASTPAPAPTPDLTPFTSIATMPSTASLPWLAAGSVATCRDGSGALPLDNVATEEEGTESVEVLLRADVAGVAAACAADLPAERALKDDVSTDRALHRTGGGGTAAQAAAAGVAPAAKEEEEKEKEEEVQVTTTTALPLEEEEEHEKKERKECVLKRKRSKRQPRLPHTPPAVATNAAAAGGAGAGGAAATDGAANGARARGHAGLSLRGYRFGPLSLGPSDSLPSAAQTPEEGVGGQGRRQSARESAREEAAAEDLPPKSLRPKGGVSFGDEKLVPAGRPAPILAPACSPAAFKAAAAALGPSGAVSAAKQRKSPRVKQKRKRSLTKEEASEDKAPKKRKRRNLRKGLRTGGATAGRGRPRVAASMAGSGRGRGGLEPEWAAKRGSGGDRGGRGGRGAAKTETSVSGRKRTASPAPPAPPLRRGMPRAARTGASIDMYEEGDTDVDVHVDGREDVDFVPPPAATRPRSKQQPHQQQQQQQQRRQQRQRARYDDGHREGMGERDEGEGVRSSSPSAACIDNGAPAHSDAAAHYSDSSADLGGSSHSDGAAQDFCTGRRANFREHSPPRPCNSGGDETAEGEDDKEDDDDEDYRDEDAPRASEDEVSETSDLEGDLGGRAGGRSSGTEGGSYSGENQRSAFAFPQSTGHANVRAQCIDRLQACEESAIHPLHRSVWLEVAGGGPSDRSRE